MQIKKTLIGALAVAVVLVAGAAFYFTSGDNLQGRFSSKTSPSMEDVLVDTSGSSGSSSSSDTRTTCDYSSDTSVANIRECLEDILVEYRSVEGENFNLIYEKLQDMQEMMDDQWTLLLGLVEEVDAIEDTVTTTED